MCFQRRVPAPAEDEAREGLTAFEQLVEDRSLLREENSDLNPIEPAYPAVPTQNVEELAVCVAARPSGANPSGDALSTGRKALWCLLSGTLPRP